MSLIFYNKRVISKKLKVKSSFEVLFRYMNHPDCCGIHNLWNFACSEEFLKTLTEEDYKKIKAILPRINKGLLIASLSSKQPHQRKFVETLGFQAIHEFKNPNSPNSVQIYHYNCE